MMRLSSALCAMWLAGCTAAMAQTPDPARSVFTREAIAAALLPVVRTGAIPQDPHSDWSRLQTLTNSEIVLFATGVEGRRCRLIAVEDAAVTVVDLQSPNQATLRVARTDVREIKQWTGRRGSVPGAVVGAALGFGLGVVSAFGLAYRQCGESCRDEKVLIGVSLVGMPLAGGVLGYRQLGGHRTLTTVYCSGSAKCGPFETVR